MDYYTYYKFVKAAYIGVKKGMVGAKLAKSLVSPCLSFIGTSILSDAFK